MACTPTVVDSAQPCFHHSKLQLLLTSAYAGSSGKMLSVKIDKVLEVTLDMELGLEDGTALGKVLVTEDGTKLVKLLGVLDDKVVVFVQVL